MADTDAPVGPRGEAGSPELRAHSETRDIRPLKSDRFYIDQVRQRLLADGYLTECTHGTPLSVPCPDCELVIGAVLRARTAI